MTNTSNTKISEKQAQNIEKQNFGCEAIVISCMSYFRILACSYYISKIQTMVGIRIREVPLYRDGNPRG